MIDDTEFDAPRMGLTPHETASDPARLISSDRPQPGWVALDHARNHGFTGEIVFHAEPEVRVYLDNGVVYFAERTGGETLGRRLLAAGLVDAVQLERGTVRVGGVEHLGRLFDREPSIDRDAVLVVTEDATAALVADLANNVIAPTTATAYRHHGSGVHRWFVAPTGIGSLSRPVTDVALVDNSVVEKLPGLPPVDAPSLGDELRIEWDEPLVDAGAMSPDPGAVATEDELHGALLDDGEFSDLLERPPGAGAPTELHPTETYPTETYPTEATRIAPPPATDEVPGETTSAGAPVADRSTGEPAPLAVPDGPTAISAAPFAPPVVADQGPEAADGWPSSDEPAFGEPAFQDPTYEPPSSGAPVSGEPATDEATLAAPFAIPDAQPQAMGATEEPQPVEAGGGSAAMPAPVVEPDPLPSSAAELADFGSSSIEFAPLTIDLDALSADDVDPEVLEVSGTSRSSVIDLPDDDEFLIVWPDGTEEVPTTHEDGVPARRSTDDAFAGLDDDHGYPTGGSAIAGEVLLPHRPLAPSPVDRGNSAAAPAPELDVLAVDGDSWLASVPEPVVESVVSDVVPVVSEPVAESVVSEPVMSESVVSDVVAAVSEPVVESVVSDAVAVVPEPVVESVVSDAVAAVSEPVAEPVVESVADQAVVSVDLDDADDRPSDGGELPSTPADVPEPLGSGRIDFEVPALILSDVPTGEGEVPDEVSNAVLRAIRAIESASTAAPSVARIAGTEAPPAPPPTEPVPMGLAPPTMETSAEVMYAAAATEESVDPVVEPVTSAEPSDRRVASVVFVDDEAAPETQDRAGALRRLIDSLRRR